MIFNCVGYTESDDKLITNDELKRVWKEVVVTYFMVQGWGRLISRPRLETGGFKV